jgi:hypothetical protein
LLVKGLIPYWNGHRAGGKCDYQSSVNCQGAGAGSIALIGTVDIFSIWMKQPQAGATNAEGKTGAEMEPIVKVLNFIDLNSHPYYGRIDTTKFNGADKGPEWAKHVPTVLECGRI